MADKKKEKTNKTVAKKKKRDGIKTGRPAPKRDMAIKLKMQKPDLTHQQIGDIMGLSRSAVEKHLNKGFSKEVFQEAEDRMREKLLTIRQDAMQGLADLVKGKVAVEEKENGKVVSKVISIPPQVRASMIKFALESFVNKNDEIQPESIEFETIISDTGVIEQTVKKNFRKE